MEFETWKKVLDVLQRDRDQAWEMTHKRFPSDSVNIDGYLFGRYVGLNTAVLKVLDLMIDHSEKG